jgi:hypothetical protein
VLVHKNTNVPVPVVYMGLVLSGFEGGLSITRGILGGWGPKNLDFFGPKWHSLATLVPFKGPKKSQGLAPPPPNAPVMDSPPSKPPLRTVPYKQQVH